MNLESLKAVAEAATPGPWIVDPQDEHSVIDEPEDEGSIAWTDEGGPAYSLNPSNATYIAALNPAIALKLIAIAQAPRGTDAQILKERELTASAIDGAMAFGYQNTNPPLDDSHWLAPYWHIGRRTAELEAVAQAAQNFLASDPFDVKSCEPAETDLLSALADLESLGAAVATQAVKGKI